MLHRARTGNLAAAGLLLVAALVVSSPLVGRLASAADTLRGQVHAGGAPLSQSTVTLWAASAGSPRQLAQTQTGPEGRFELPFDPAGSDDVIFYLVATGGQPAPRGGGDNPAIGLMAVLGSQPPSQVTINELTTIASVWTAAQFLNGTALQGPTLGLRIAASNVPNFVDLASGGYGVTIQDAMNSNQTPTMANFATLGSILAGCTTRVRADACSSLFAAATPPTGTAPTDTLAAAQAIARNSSYQPDKVFALLNAFYPVPQGKNLRSTPYMPYLTWAPSAWSLPLRFTGGGLLAAGKLMIDSQGNVWAGDNFIVGAQNQDALWDGNLSKFAPDGRPLSPMTTGFTGGGLEGIGFGLAIDAGDNVWATTYGSKAIVRFDNSGRPLSPPEGYTFNGQLGLMQGIIATPSGDIWALDIEKGQLVHLPNGDPARGELLCQNRSGNPADNPCRLAAPFHLAIDQQDRIWVTNAVGDWVTRFPASDPTRVETFKAGYSGSGLGIDSQGNIWITNRFGSSDQGQATLLRVQQTATSGGNFDEVLTRATSTQRAGPNGGSVTVLRPDGSELPGSPLTGRGLAGPWAIAVDGDDHVWVSNFTSPTSGIVELCGVRTETCPPGMQTGDAISPPGGYVGGGMQLLIDIGIDPAGNVWVDNNWQDLDSCFGTPAEPLSALCGGQGLVVFYGLAKPVRTPLIGPARAP
jgi:hypothetical protein